MSTVVVVDEAERLEFAEERISGVLLPASNLSSASVGFIAPGVAQTPHFHERPSDGVEIVFVYVGAFRIIENGVASRVYDTATEGPVYVEIPSGTQASLENIGTGEVRFFSVFAPPFAPGEIHYVASSDGSQASI